jgi:CheY-like chemotaxis protein
MPRIFDAFEQGGATVTRQFGGLGLGLAICKALVDLHHGSIRAESGGPGLGSTFIVELPSATPAVLERQADAQPVVDRKSRQIRVLLVEDHLDTAHTLSRLLHRSGFVVVRATDVATAAARAEAENFDVLVSDLGLPDGNGYDVIRRIRAHQIVPAIAMSGYGMDEDVRRTREAGFTEHLVKPIDVPQLIAAGKRPRLIYAPGANAPGDARQGTLSAAARRRM